MPPLLQLDAPPIVPWSEWIREQAYVEPGHMLFSGPTQSGKTLLCREVVGIKWNGESLRRCKVVCGTKPVDKSLDAYVNEGYTRIDHWPPTRSEIKRQLEQNGDGSVGFILWPKIRTRADLRKPATKDLFARMLDDIFIEGDWTIVIDEGLWFSSPSGLNLGQPLGDMAYGSASNGVHLYILVQRPANVPPVVWTSVSQALLFKSGRTDDIRELASLGTNTPQEVSLAIRNLGKFQFLDLPVRSGADWAVSKVEK